MAGNSQLVLKGIALERGGRTLFSGLNLDLGPGGAALVSGPNGVGKSSLLRMIAGLLPPAAGDMQVEGGIALADERLALEADQPLADALGWWARLDGQGGDAVDQSLACLSLDHLASVPVRMLSTGQRKRAVLARTLASGADIWLLDEPANGLDAASLPLLEQAIARHRASGGIAVVATHQALDLPQALKTDLGA